MFFEKTVEGWCYTMLYCKIHNLFIGPCKLFSKLVHCDVLVLLSIATSPNILQELSKVIYQRPQSS
jgi:hypothetical protein